MSNANFFLKEKILILLINLFKNPFSEKKINATKIKKSKFFFNDKNKI